MGLTGKQRAKLRSMANTVEAIVHIGKDGVSESVIAQADEALTARELIKCSVQQNAGLGAREACEALCVATGAEPIQAIGRKFVLYRKNEDKPAVIALD